MYERDAITGPITSNYLWIWTNITSPALLLQFVTLSMAQPDVLIISTATYTCQLSLISIITTNLSTISDFIATIANTAIMTNCLLFQKVQIFSSLLTHVGILT